MADLGGFQGSSIETPFFPDHSVCLYPVVVHGTPLLAGGIDFVLHRIPLLTEVLLWLTLGHTKLIFSFWSTAHMPFWKIEFIRTIVLLYTACCIIIFMEVMTLQLSNHLSIVNSVAISCPEVLMCCPPACFS